MFECEYKTLLYRGIWPQSNIGNAKSDTTLPSFAGCLGVYVGMVGQNAKKCEFESVSESTSDRVRWDWGNVRENGNSLMVLGRVGGRAVCNRKSKACEGMLVVSFLEIGEQRVPEKWESIKLSVDECQDRRRPECEWFLRVLWGVDAGECSCECLLFAWKNWVVRVDGIFGNTA